MVRRGWVQGIGRVRLAYLDYGGTGPAVLLLHDLLARATTWDETARWLTPRFRVVAVDSRGHGWSDAPQGPYDLPAHVGDATTTIERLGLGPAVVIGHAMGALTACALAVRRPDLVRALVLAAMSPAAAPWAAERDDWLDSWPVPFVTLAQARAFFSARHPSWGDYYLEVLAESADGYRPMFDRQHVAQARTACRARDHWADAERVRCPALVVTGARAAHAGGVAAESRGSARQLRQGRYLEVADAGHVVHYDQPHAWRAAVEPFLLSVVGEHGGGPDGARG